MFPRWVVMCSAWFVQQIHMWRWTGNATHEKLLRPGLELHAQWAEDCFDDDRNGLYHSYINTWPTDSVYYNGGESVEETGYMLLTHRALHDMAARAGDQTAATAHAEADPCLQEEYCEGHCAQPPHPPRAPRHLTCSNGSCGRRRVLRSGQLQEGGARVRCLRLHSTLLPFTQF